MLENFQIFTHHYNLNQKQNRVIQNMVDTLVQKIPCNSVIRIDLQYQKNKFIGKLEIKTNKKTFFSHTSGETISQLMKSLNKKILNQVLKWKKSRTRKEITGIIDLIDLKNQSKYFEKAS